MMMRKKRVYMDYAAATPVDTRVLGAMLPYFSKNYGNPGSLHREALEAKAAVEQARTTVANLLGARPGEIIFVGGGTESDNLAIIGTVQVFRRINQSVIPHVIVSTIEHKAVLETVRALRDAGDIELSEIPVGSDGVIDLKLFKQALKPTTVLVSVMYASNEIGTIQPIREITKIIRHHRKNVTTNAYPLFHTDAIQAFQYCDSNVLRLGVDLMTVSAAKIYGPKGIAVLYVRTGVAIDPTIHGGGQEHGLRSGTENVPLIVGCAKAFSIADELRERELARLEIMRTYFIKKLTSAFPDCRTNGLADNNIPNIVNVTFPNISGERLVIELDAQGIAVSAQSACTTDDEDSSYVIAALYPDANTEEGGIRFSMGRSTKKSDINQVIKSLQVIIKRITDTSALLKL